MKRTTNRNANTPDNLPQQKSRPKATQPVDISTGKSKGARDTSKAYATASPANGFDPSATGAGSAQPEFEARHQRVLELLALGSSVSSAAESVGVSRSLFYKWCKADETYEHYAHRARGIHIADVDDALHELDTDSRALIHRIVLDDNISAGIRLRAALAALTRRGPGWLPRELPPHEYGRQSPQSSNPDPAVRPASTAPATGDEAPASSQENVSFEPSPLNDSQPTQLQSAKPGIESRQVETAESVESVETVSVSSQFIELSANQSFPSIANSIDDRRNSVESVESVEFVERAKPHGAQHPSGQSNDQCPLGPLPPSELPNTQESPAVSTNERPVSRLDTVFLSRYILHRHESRRDFDRLFREVLAAHEPQSRAEELTVLRIAQCLWQIRRVDTMEMAVSDATVDQVRISSPGAHPAAALASVFLHAKPSLQMLFFERLRGYRRMHEETLDRLENRLIRQQNSRHANQLRDARRQQCRRGLNYLERAGGCSASSFDRQINRKLSLALTPVAPSHRIG